MPDIRLTRIDNRLIHGQVATQWCGVVGANLLLVANDAVAADEFRQSLMNMAAPAYAQTRFFTIQKTKMCIRDRVIIIRNSGRRRYGRRI